MTVVYTYRGLPIAKSGPEPHDCPYANVCCEENWLCPMCEEDGPAEGESQDAFESRRSGVPMRGPI